MSINVSKTKLIIFKPRQRSLPNISPLTLDSHVVELVESTKFLGVYIDQHFTWQTHINVISKKIAKSIGLIYRASFYLLKNSLLSLYYVLIYPYLTYCNLVWASTCITNLQRVYLLQKRVVRLITKSDYRYHIYVSLVHTHCKLVLLCICIITINCHFPSSTFLKLVDKFIRTQRETQKSYRSHICRTNFKKFSILYQGPRIWNSLPVHIKTASSFQSFKQLMKLFLRDKQDNATHI